MYDLYDDPYAEEARLEEEYNNFVEAFYADAEDEECPSFEKWMKMVEENYSNREEDYEELYD